MNEATRNRIGVILIALAIPALAHAQMVGGTDPGTFIQNIANMVLSWWGIGIATLIIMFAGITVLVGRHSLEFLMRVVFGLALIFGASAIAAQV